VTQSTAELVRRLRSFAEHLEPAAGDYGDEIDALAQAATALEAQQAEIDKLVEALRPFAKAAHDAERMAGHDGPLGQHMFFSDLVAARSALKEVTGEE